MSSTRQRWLKAVADQTGASPEDVEVLEFGAKLLVNCVMDITVIFTIAFFLGTLPSVAVGYFVVAVLKYFAGGAHAHTMLNCLIIGVVVYTSMGLLAHTLATWSPITPPITFAGVSALSVGAFTKFAPATPPQKPVRSARHYQHLKKGALLTLSAVLILGAFYLIRPFAPQELFWAGCLALVWQSFILFPGSRRLFENIERYLF